LPNGQEQVFYTVTSGDTLSSIASSLASAVNSDTNLAAQGITANASSAVISITQPSTTYSASNSSGASEYIYLHNNNNGNIVAEIGGTTTAGDNLTLTVADPRLSGGTESVSYTVLSTDTVTTIAGAIASLINADSNLTNIGIKASYTAPAKFDWSQSFTAKQLTPYWNQSVMSATDAVPNTATAQYGIYTAGPNLSTPTYDLNGNMTSDGTNSYQWDAENRLVQITYPGTGNYSQFSFDGFGKCVKIAEFSGGSLSSTKQFVWVGSNIAEARDAASTILSQYFSLGQTISGSIYFFTKDYLSSIRELTDGSGVIKAEYSYDPYGRVAKLQGSLASDYQYAGYYFHAPSGLSLAMRRAYDASLGRWINRDPIRESGGFNLYPYVNNRTMNSRDPSGLDGKDPEAPPCIKDWAGCRQWCLDTGSTIVDDPVLKDGWINACLRRCAQKFPDWRPEKDKQLPKYHNYLPPIIPPILLIPVPIPIPIPIPVEPVPVPIPIPIPALPIPLPPINGYQPILLPFPYLI